MDELIAIVVAGALLFGAYRIRRKSFIAYWRHEHQIYIDKYVFPDIIISKIREHHSHLNEEQAYLVLTGLREYFHICNIAGKGMVSMPSKVVDDAWHEFILFTKEYQLFCKKALGRFLHYTPAKEMKSKIFIRPGIRRAWQLSCDRENISSTSPKKLPMLFSLDTTLNIMHGFKYALNPNSNDKSYYYVGHIDFESDSDCGGGCGDD